MRHPMLFAAAALVGMSVLARPAAAQKPGAGAGPHGMLPGKAAPAARAPGVPVLDVNALATAAALDAKTKARVAPHVAAMNREMDTMHGIMGRFSKTLPRATQDSMHQALKTHYDAFDARWKDADAAIPQAKQAAFDAAVRQQMGVRSTAAVGNPHQKLPAMHPKLNPDGSAAKKK